MIPTSLTNLKSGEVYSPTDIQSNISKLEERLQAVGFEFIRVRPTFTRNMSSLTIDLDLIFEKSDKLFIERIDISGNTATLDRVVRRQFFVIEGDPFNSREIKAAADRIRSLGLFSDSIVKVLPGSRDSLVVIDVKVIERPPGSLTFGAGYSSAAGLGGLIEYDEKNFLGRGQALSFAINTGKDDQLYELSFYEPMFLRNDLGLGINLSAKDTQQQNAAYDTDSLNFEPEGELVDFLQAIRRDDRVSNEDYEQLVQDIGMRAFDNEGISAQDLNRVMRKSTMYAEDPETGDLVNNDVFRNALQEAGFDTIKMDADTFKMEGVEGAEHRIFLKPEQLRSINAEFDPEKKDSSNLLSSILDQRFRNIA